MVRDDDSRGSFLVLLTTLLALFALHSLMDRILLDLLMSAILLAGLWSVSRKSSTLIVGLVLFVPALAVKWGARLAQNPDLVVMGVFFAIAFITFTAMTILVTVLRAQKVTTDTILGAICVYLLMAVMFALAYSALELLHPGSFVAEAGVPAISALRDRTVSPELLYFSVTSITTAGFGDIHPATSAAQTLTSFEVLASQLYLAVLIARLVGLHASKRGSG